MGYDLNYRASPTIGRFLESRAPRKILSGAVGGGKTSGCVIHTLMNAMQQEPDNDGIRRSRHLVVRNTVPQLRQTVTKTFIDWLPPEVFGKFNISDRLFTLKFSDVHAEILFLAIEEEFSLRQLLSLECSTIYLNEMRELSQSVIEGIVGAKRTGRYPSRKQGPGATYPCIIADTNMPAYDTYHQRIMDGLEGDWVTFRQPGGRSPEAENLEFLPPDYYNTDGLTAEYIRTMIDCEYGTSKEGMPVFRSTFIKDFHVAKEPLLPLRSSTYPLLIGLDAGLTPAATIGQLTPTGRVNILGECFTEKTESMGMERFLSARLVPMLRNKFSGCEVLVVVDPASEQRSQASEETVFQIIQKSGLKVRSAASNKIDLRIGSAETLFGRQVGGQAGLLIDAGCMGLINALSHEYKFAMRRDGDVEDKPLKNHPHSDLCFVAGTPVLTPSGWVAIEQLQTGDEVAVPDGIDKVTHTGTRFAKKILRVMLSNGVEIQCTPEHPFAVNATCFLPADALYSGLELVQPEGIWGFQKECVIQQSAKCLSSVVYAAWNSLLCSGRSIKEKARHALKYAETWLEGAMMVCLSTVCGSGGAARTTISGINIQTKQADHYTNTCGKSQTVLCRRDLLCTTKITTQRTTLLKTLNLWRRATIAECTSKSASIAARLTTLLHLLKRKKPQKNGTHPKKDGSGIKSTQKKSLLHVVRVDCMSGGQNVFNLTTHRTHVFYAGGVLVHNCDSFTYLTSYVIGSSGIQKTTRREIKGVSSRGWT